MAQLSHLDVLVQVCGGDAPGQLVFADGRLCAVLTHLEADNPTGDAWFLEAGFGPCEAHPEPTFRSVDAADRWIADRLAQRAA